MQMRKLLVAVVLTSMTGAPCMGQQRSGIIGDLQKDIAEVQMKLVGLAREMPAATHDWRPAPGVRSVREVFLHVAADNYFLPAAAGVEPPARSGISGTDFNTLTTFEQRKLTRDQIVSALQESFAHLLKALADTRDADLEKRIKFFGQDMTVRALWLATATHMHEHLGQAIAYARSNNVVPPWSK